MPLPMPMPLCTNEGGRPEGRVTSNVRLASVPSSSATRAGTAERRLSSSHVVVVVCKVAHERERKK